MGIPKLLTPEEVSEILGVSKNLLAIWRCTGRYSLPFLKVGRLVRYEPHAVEAWLNRQKHDFYPSEKE